MLYEQIAAPLLKTLVIAAANLVGLQSRKTLRECPVSLLARRLCLASRLSKAHKALKSYAISQSSIPCWSLFVWYGDVDEVCVETSCACESDNKFG